jgi:hypothetical protein
VADCADALRGLLSQVGVDRLSAFEKRSPRFVPIGDPVPEA